MPLVRGDRLAPEARAEVLRIFVHRWTHENSQQSYHGKCPACEQSRRTSGGRYVVITGVPGRCKVWTMAEWHAYHQPLTTDDHWLAAHAFKVTRAGRLDQRGHYAHPASLAD